MNSTSHQKLNSIIHNIEQFNINDLEKLQTFILKNQGNETHYYVENIPFHTFTDASFEFLINQINTNRNTYFDIGPFINKNGLWYSNKSKKNLEEIIESLENTISIQQKEILQLKQKLYQ